MSFEGQDFAQTKQEPTAQELMALAAEYRRAADGLRHTGRAGKPLSRAPYRLVAIHAIELYLTALLVAGGHAYADVRRLGHKLDDRSGIAAAKGIKLRKRTVAHLERLTSTREYVASRYDPRMSELSQINRLEATLKQVAEAVTERVRRP
jgi:hypothetical protein